MGKKILRAILIVVLIVVSLPFLASLFVGLYEWRHALIPLREGETGRPVSPDRCAAGLVKGALIEPNPDYRPQPTGADGQAIGLSIDRKCGPGPMNVFICLKCGDGVCGKAENFCNCSVDCPEPSWQ